MSSLILNRLSGLITSGPSFMLNVSVLNAVLITSRGTFVQRASLVACGISIVVNFLIVYTLTMWFIDRSWPDFTKFVVVFAVLKRLYSVIPVYMTFLRLQAISDTSRVGNVNSRIYVGVYSVLSIVTAVLHFQSYYALNWNSLEARDSALFKVYRYANLITTTYYVSMGFWVDIAFVRVARKNAYLEQALRSVRQYFNVWIYIVYEVALYIIFMVTIIWSTFDIDVTASIYLEQVLLSFMMCNGVFLVVAIPTGVRSCPAQTWSALPPTTPAPLEQIAVPNFKRQTHLRQRSNSSAIDVMSL